MELENYDIFFRVYLKEEEEKNGTIHHGGISLGCLSSNALLCYTGPKLEGCSFQAHFENKSTSRKWKHILKMKAHSKNLLDRMWY